MKTKDYRNIAKKFRDNNLVVIPLDDKKQPYNSETGECFPWHWFQERFPTDKEIDRWYKSCNSLGLLTGCGVEAIDCDAKYFTNPNLMTEFREKIPQEIFNKLVIQQSKNKGYHWVYKSPKIEPNQKLACRETTDEEVQDYLFKEYLKNKEKGIDFPMKKAIKSSSNYKSLVLLETRGGTNEKRMGYIVIADPEQTLDNGYKLLRGNFLQLPTLTEEERDVIISTAREFNEVKEAVSNFKAVKASKGGMDLYDRYNQDVIGLDLLIEHGWEEESRRGKDVRLVRPGNPDSKSSGQFDTETNLFVCYSTSSDFEPRRGYTPVNLLAELAFEGDYSRVYKYLEEMYEK